MAVTSIWSIKGWIGKVIKYAENPDKTKENNEGQISENQSQSTQGLEDVITYAVNTEKTRRGQSESMERELVGESEELMEQYVSGVNCAPTTAREEMIAVKKRFGKEGGIVAFHGYQSFAHSGNYSTNYQNTGRELMTPDEVRMLDNRYAILFIRGERPILDEKFDILKHPNVGFTTDGNGKPYLHGAVDRAVASISLGDSLEGELTDDALESEDYELLSDEDLEEIIQKYV